MNIKILFVAAAVAANINLTSTFENHRKSIRSYYFKKNWELVYDKEGVTIFHPKKQNTELKSGWHKKAVWNYFQWEASKKRIK